MLQMFYIQVDISTSTLSLVGKSVWRSKAKFSRLGLLAQFIMGGGPQSET